MASTRLIGPIRLSDTSIILYGGGSATTLTNIQLVNSSISDVLVSIWLNAEAPENLLYQARVKGLTTTSFIGQVSIAAEDALLGKAEIADYVTITINSNASA